MSETLPVLESCCALFLLEGVLSMENCGGLLLLESLLVGFGPVVHFQADRNSTKRQQ
jgi:hypothetical protein